MADEPTEPTPEPEPEPTPEPAAQEPVEPAEEPLGEGGKRALDAERAARKAAERRATEIEAQLAEMREAQMSEQERAVAEARREGEQTATEKANSRLFSAEVRAAASSKLTDPDLFADPDVAMRLLGLDAVPTNDVGDIDQAAIAGAIDALLEAKPYLAAASATRPNGDADGGARGTSKPGQLTRDQLSSMTPEAIVEAKAAGQLNEVLGIT